VEINCFHFVLKLSIVPLTTDPFERFSQLENDYSTVLFRMCHYNYSWAYSRHRQFKRSSITEDIRTINLTGLAILATFYFGFRDIAKQVVRKLLSSILVRLCQQSDRFSDVLSSVYSPYGDGTRGHLISSACKGVSPDVRG